MLIENVSIVYCFLYLNKPLQKKSIKKADKIIETNLACRGFVCTRAKSQLNPESRNRFICLQSFGISTVLESIVVFAQNMTAKHNRVTP